MILFLDFDGVLHPEFCSDLQIFCHLEQFESVLRDCPHVDIVISSTWRQTRSFTELRTLFSPDIGARIVGMTPIWQDLPKLVDVLGNYPRHVEIEGWLRQSNRIWERWLAIDDRPYWFKPFLSNLVVCDTETGIDDEVEHQLRRKLSH